MAVGIAQIKEICVRDSVAARTALDAIGLIRTGQNIAELRNPGAIGKPISEMMQARTGAVGGCEVVRMALALHAGAAMQIEALQQPRMFDRLEIERDRETEGILHSENAGAIHIFLPAE